MRLGIPVAARELRFGDPYYPCPHGCDAGTYYDGTNGVCYGCHEKFLTTGPRAAGSLLMHINPTKLKRALVGFSIIAALLYVTRERGK
jgi:hypothetical protein